MPADLKVVQSNLATDPRPQQIAQEACRKGPYNRSARVIRRNQTMKRAILSAVIGLVWITAATADDAAKALVDRAIEAHGGTAILSKFPAGQVKSRGTLIVRDKSEPFV